MLLFRNDPFFNLIDSFVETSKTKVPFKGFVEFYRTQDESEYKLEFIVPSLSKEDITVLLEDDLLKIKYEKPEDSKQKFIDSFERTFTLPEDINDKKIDAKVENGILTVTLPKQKKKLNTREISIN